MRISRVRGNEAESVLNFQTYGLFIEMKTGVCGAISRMKNMNIKRKVTRHCHANFQIWEFSMQWEIAFNFTTAFPFTRVFKPI